MSSRTLKEVTWDVAPVDFIVSQIGPTALLLLLVDYFGPIRHTIKSAVAATTELRTVPWM